MISLKDKAGTAMSCRSTRFSIPSLIQKWFCCIVFMAIGSGLTAQQVRSVAVSEYYGDFSNVAISGDTLKFQLEIGTMAAPVQNAVGYDLAFGCPDLQSAPASVLVLVDGTWLTEGISDPEPSWVFDWSTKALSIDYLRSDLTGQTGYGVVATICLIRPGGFGADENNIALDGGVVMVENISLKQNAHPQEFQVFPNPTADYVEISVEHPENSTLKILNFRGELILSQPFVQFQRIDLSRLASGSYWISVESDRGCSRKLVVVQ